MKWRFKKIVLVLCLILSIAGIVGAQTLSLSGSLHRYNPSGSHPYPAPGYQVYLYSRSTGSIGPAITDSYGRYAFYNVRSGSYLMRIYFSGRQVWQQQVRVPGSVNPIVIR